MRQGHDAMNRQTLQSPAWRALIWFVSWMAFGFLLVQSVTVTLDWWQNKRTDIGVWEWLWIGLLPVLVFVYFRFFSIFNPGCQACAPDADRHEGKTPKA